MPTDTELLRAFVREGSESAFAEVVQRYAGLVYAAARRQAGGDAHLAEDVTQEVFIVLARKAPMLVGHETLAGWLHTTTRRATLNQLRDRRRRETREQEAAAMLDQSEPPISWEQLCPLLDEAVGQLAERDRNAVLLRYFQGQSHREVGAALGLSEDTARVRTERAVEKLRGHFARRGVALTGTGLAAALSANAAEAAPPALAGKVAAVAQAEGLGFGHAALKALYMTTKTKLVLAATVIMVVATFTFVARFERQAPGWPVSATKKTAKNSMPAAAEALAKAKAGLAKALGTPGRMIHDRAMLDYVESLDAATAKALLADYSVNQPLASWETMEALGDLSYRWAELEPQAALAWLADNPDPEVQRLCMSSMLDAYSEKDPQAALEAMTKLPPSFSNPATNVVVVMNYARQDPQAALAALRNMPDSQNYDSLQFIAYQAWAQTDPQAAAVDALANSSGMGPGMTLQYIANEWAAQDPNAALNWASTLPSGMQRNLAIQGALRAISRTDPETAANESLSLTGTAPGPLMTMDWAEQDPQGMLNWADQNLAGMPYNSAVQSALRSLDAENPTAAAAYLAQNPDPAVLGRAVPQLAETWAQQNLPAALAWAQTLPTDNMGLRDSAVNNVFSGWTNLDPAAAAAYVQQNLAGDPAFQSVANNLAKNWGDVDPQAAVKWAQNLPPGDAQNEVLQTAINKLAAVNPQSAGQAAQSALDNLTGLSATEQTALQKLAGQAAKP